jgi:hypothetical protein
VAHWELTVFSSTTEELLTVLSLTPLSADEVRQLWDLPPHVPIGCLPVGDDEWPLIRRHLDVDDEVPMGDIEAFLELNQDFPGEVIEEADGTRWFPPP